MRAVSYLFPGQGAQYVGMGQDLYQQFPEARAVFDQADQILGFDLSGLIFSGPAEQLTETINCQVAVFTVSIACLRSLQAARFDWDVKYTAGLSLGEYTALVAAGAMDFSAGLRLLRQRAEFMEAAAQQNPGGMVSLIGLAPEAVRQICLQTKTEIANLNCPGQVVISGSLSGLDQAKQLALAQGAKKAIPLNVSGAFHSSLMEPAKVSLAAVLAQAEISAPRVPVISNVTAVQEDSAAEIKDNLARQVAAGTRWEDSIRFISSRGTRRFLEIGPGKVLKGLLRKIDPELQVDNIGTAEDLERLKRG
ncbi:ACP S-malonyltransferase [Candidatus Omnitrophota bacterium]